VGQERKGCGKKRMGIAKDEWVWPGLQCARKDRPVDLLTCSCLLIIVATPLYSDLLALVLQVCKEVHYQAGLIID